jgi:hypothetical protein
LFLLTYFLCFFDPTRSELDALIVRLVKIAGFSILLASLIYVSLCYYFFMIRYGKGIFLSNILTLWFGCAVMFALVYSGLYQLDSAFFEYKNPPYVPSALIQHVGWSGMKALADFLFYSMLNSVMANYWKIRPNSYLISCLSVAQTLHGLFVILFVFGAVTAKFKK